MAVVNRDGILSGYGDFESHIITSFSESYQRKAGVDTNRNLSVRGIGVDPFGVESRHISHLKRESRVKQ